MGDAGGRSIFVSYAGRPLIMQTPEMFCPWGISQFDGSNKYSIQLSFQGKESREGVAAFYNLMTALDEKLVNDAAENSLQWLHKKYSPQVLAEADKITKIIKHAKDKVTHEIADKFPPTMSLNLPYRDNKFECDVYDSNKQKVDLSELGDLKGSRVTAIIQATGVWVAAGRLGISWKVVQMRVRTGDASRITGYAFKDDEDCHPDQLDDEIPAPPRGRTAPAETVTSSDDDDELENGIKN
eukprot:jgi/Chrzof1/9272/UNPLg00239.t1